MYPEIYNLLRKELHDHWPALFRRVGWYMAFDWPSFMEEMNKFLDLRVSIVVGGDEEVCDIYMSALRAKRGAIEIN